MAGNLKADFEREKPGWTLEETLSRPAQDAARPVEEPDMVGPSYSELKKKYLPDGSKGSKTLDKGSKTLDSDSEDVPAKGKDGWARLRDKDAPDSPVGPKAVLYDKRTKRLKAVQG